MGKIKIDYFTDPICSFCYAFEPVWKKIIETYGECADINCHMGGLLKSWDNFNSGDGISKPSDVAEHWEHVGKQTGVPMSGDVWRNDPIKSSYPACIAYYAVHKIDSNKSQLFLAEMRKKAFIDSQNIGKADVLTNIAEQCGIEKNLFLKEFSSDFCEKEFSNDLKYAQSMGVSGFPTIVMTSDSKSLKIVGFKNFTEYESVFNSLI